MVVLRPAVQFRKKVSVRVVIFLGVKQWVSPDPARYEVKDAIMKRKVNFGGFQTCRTVENKNICKGRNFFGVKKRVSADVRICCGVCNSEEKRKLWWSSDLENSWKRKISVRVVFFLEVKQWVSPDAARI